MTKPDLVAEIVKDTGGGHSHPQAEGRSVFGR